MCFSMHRRTVGQVTYASGISSTVLLNHIMEHVGVHGVSDLLYIYTLWLFNIAMGNGPFIDGLPIKNGDFPWLC